MVVLKSLGLISLGATLGAGLRYMLSISLNHWFKSFAFGTLIANCMGCFLMGLCLAVFAHYPNLNSHWKIMIITGFLGSFTTFSSFAGEVYEYLSTDNWLNALQVIGLHLVGGLFFTALGVACWKALH